MPKIVLTGGGTAGHVTPNIALLPSLKEAGFEIFYVGSYEGMEKGLIEAEGIPYYGISSGKLRRYFDVKNFSDPFRVIKGYSEAVSILKELRPDVVFSKGGFVSVPVVAAAGQLHIPVICHESDMTPGLANKLSFPFATKICCTFEETKDKLPAEKAVVTGSPIRETLSKGSISKALSYTGFHGDKPVILIIGGSLGAASVNEAVRRILPQLLPDFDVIHLCGKGKLDTAYNDLEGYVQYEYVKKELKDLFALSTIVISRAGSNAICELLALKKPALLIPLSAKASRGDQVLNARSFEKKGYSILLEEEHLTDASLLQKIKNLYGQREDYIKAMSNATEGNAIKTITKMLVEAARAEK